MDMDLYDILKKANKEEILTIITMTIMYFTETYGYSYNTTMNLIKGGYKQLKKMKESE